MRKIVVYFHAGRVVIVNGSKPIGVLTAGDIINHFYEKLAILRDFPDRTVEAVLKKAFKSVHSLKSSERAIDGFSKMVENNVSGLAILNDDDTLCNVLSAKDLKQVQGSSFSTVFLPVGKFLDEKIKRQKKFVSVKKDSTLKEVMKEFVDLKIHRLFIVDDNNKVVGVITGSDVVAAILEFTKEKEE